MRRGESLAEHDDGGRCVQARWHVHYRHLAALCAEESYTAGESVEQAFAKSTDRTVALHREEVMSADGLLIAHANGWRKPPAILAGWLDRVLVPGVAYRLQSAEGEPDGRLSARGSAGR